ncbi:MAG: SWIM zinc finger family protein [Coriobacteriia bacterium]|nr:SWIM zinc finger family protein [Coriobacteriia bacterium]
MGRGYNNFPQYETIAEKKAKAARRLEKLRKTNPQIRPIAIEGRSIARSWWAKSWNANLESYADYANRIERGKSYLKSGMVLDLIIEEGLVTALVLGSGNKLYTVTVRIDELPQKKWESILDICGRQISSTAELIDGVFPPEFGERFLDQKSGLFPSPREIHFACTCPDWAYMCKHVAAVLYGIGARFDDDPLLFFKLRAVPYEDLLRESVESNLHQLLKNASKKSARTLTNVDIDSVFGL